MKYARYLEVSEARDINVLKSRLLSFAYDLDFGMMSATLVVDRPASAKPVFTTIGNLPAAYLEASGKDSSVKRDPVMQRLKRSSVPFIYSHDTYLDAGVVDLWEEQARFGFKTGVAVALHLPPGDKHFLLGFDRDRPLPSDEGELTQLLASLQLMAVHAQDAAVRLMATPETIKSAVTLSPREREVLRWTMEGKTAWEVGEIVGISEATVNYHVVRAMRKLEAATKHQAALKAMSLGLLA